MVYHWGMSKILHGKLSSSHYWAKRVGRVKKRLRHMLKAKQFKLFDDDQLWWGLR